MYKKMIGVSHCNTINVQYMSTQYKYFENNNNNKKTTNTFIYKYKKILHHGASASWGLKAFFFFFSVCVFYGYARNRKYFY